MINNISRYRSLFGTPFLLVSILLIGSLVGAHAQTPSPTPTPAPSTEGTYGNFEITATGEFGIRGLEVNGNHEKYRSDLNYKNGFRVFDSSFLIENNSKNTGLFDSMLVTTSGFGADPSGIFRMNIEKTGIYKFDSNMRRVKYFNNLNNHALSQHDADLRHNFGDFDLTVFPERETLRFRFGYSFNQTDGKAGWNHRGNFGDEFPVDSFVDTTSHDLRAGIEGKVLGFNLSAMYGHRVFTDDTRYTSQGLNLGNNPTDAARMTLFEREYPVRGTTNFGVFNIQRSFAKRLDFTGRLIYSYSKSDFKMFERAVGTDTGQRSPTLPAGRIDLDQVEVNGDSSRPQIRGDIGLTYRVTNAFRISNTFTYDRFSISGGNLFAQDLYLGPANNGTPRASRFIDTLSHWVTGYRRTMNLIEADYQFGRWLGVNVGYRFTDRKVDLSTFERTFSSPTATVHSDQFTNKTHSVIAGAKVKPYKNWSIFADVEHGNSDNVFVRLANTDYTNVRVRSIARFNKFAVNLSFITKDNENPGRSAEINDPNFTAISKSRYFSGSVDWFPHDKFSINTGYTFQHVNSSVDIIIPVGAPTFPSTQRLHGVSQYFVRDSYFFVDVTARPIKRVSLYASYRINDDDGQGDRVVTRPQDIISSYPMTFHTPEARLAIRLTKNIDWNIGYQYYDYKERQTWFPFVNQNYTAHLPYTSLRIYLGKGAVDR